MKIKSFHFWIVRNSKLRANLNVEGSGAVVSRLWIFTFTGIMECYFIFSHIYFICQGRSSWWKHSWRLILLPLDEVTQKLALQIRSKLNWNHNRDAGLSIKAWLDVNDNNHDAVAEVLNAYVGWVQKVQKQKWVLYIPVTGVRGPGQHAEKRNM